MIKIVKGDLLSVTHGVVAHSCNCQGVMNSGVAKQIRNKYPKAYEEYMETVNDHMLSGDKRENLLGKVNGVSIGRKLYIANMFGQFNYGYDGKKYTNEEALFSCFKTVRTVAEKADLPVAMPYRIGSYRGGADWLLVEDYLLTAFDGYEVTLYKYHEG